MKCPICGRPRDQKYRPFCSKRCTDVDLARWLDGSYAIPDEGADTAENTPPTPVFRGDDV
ncbi:DNA gyrase inhibitor YacG [Pontivivens nitratireducens]|uniref:DNA gyrase inhibitor YacG n=1 Tax=Pontivivens nitratireducens TaxID=2758038 RepID=UPI00163A4418